MNYLFLHQNFPGQYRYLVRHLADNPDNVIYFISQPNNNRMRGVNIVTYKPYVPKQLNCHPFSVDFDLAVRNGLAVTKACRALLGQGFVPDIVIGHAGWGEMLFIKDVFPDTPVLSYFEFYYHFSNVDVGFDPEFPASPDDAMRLRTKNAINLLSFDSADWGHAPTRWQRTVHPPELRPRITVVHEGVETAVAKPNTEAWLQLARDGTTLSHRDEVITYVARNLEPYRGFHIFMRALPLIQRRRPNAHALIVGGDGVSYGAAAPNGTTYRELMLREVGPELDMSRVHFLGQIPYEFHLNVLQVSSAHVYLTYPFVLSWSFVEAMASGCAIIGSATPPVLEVLQDRVNGLLVNFFSPEEIAERVDEILDHPDRMMAMRHAARETAVKQFDLQERILPLWNELINDLMNGKRPSLRA